MCSYATPWITEHRHDIMAHYGEIADVRSASEQTSIVWWVLCSVTASITSLFRTVVMWLQENRLKLSLQES